MKLTFLGGAGTVTGSKYLIESDGRRILVDCGLFQGLKELRLRNWAPFPFPPASIDAILLTHAHLDHCGYIPRLVKDGFSGTVYCTKATLDLCRIILPDSGHIQEEDAFQANRHGYSRHHPALPLYTEEDARKCLERFRAFPFGERHSLEGTGLEFSLHRAGHILGAASIVLHNEDGTSVLFSGDVGRMHDPIMKPPAQIQKADYIVVESTYGDRLHDTASPEDELAGIINRTAARGGTVIIPAFAVGRAQSLLYYIHMLKRAGRIADHIPVYLDSPMAIDASDLLGKHMNDHRLPPGLCKAVCTTARYVRTPAESKALDDSRAKIPSVIISASGMATGGRVLHHLKHFMGDPRNTVLLAGFQAAGTRGDRLARGEKEIKIHGQMWPVKAEVVKIDSLSAHADYSEILEWLGHISSQPRKIFVTHGEPEAAASLKEKILGRFGWNTVVPIHLQSEVL